MSIKLHKVIHCFDSLIILLYEHPITIYCDTQDSLIWMSSVSGFTNQTPQKKKHNQNTSLKTKFNLI